MTDTPSPRRRDLGERPNRCVAKNHKTGERCQNYAIRGGSVCRFHGGAARQVRERAKLRIQLAADPAAAKLVELMRSRRTSPTVQLAAARDLLDRAGLNSVEHVQVTVQPWQDLLPGGGVAVDLGEVQVETPIEPTSSDLGHEPLEPLSRPRRTTASKRKPDPLPPGYTPRRRGYRPSV